MKKWLLIISVSFVIIVIILLVIGLSNIDTIIKNAVNTYGPKITGTRVHLEEVSVSILSGKAKLKNFYLGVPKGFNSPYTIKLKSACVEIDESSLSQNPIIINKIEIINPDIIYEKKKGTDNLKAILNNIKKAVGRTHPTSTEEKSPKKKSSESKKILIKDLVIKNGKVNMAIGILGNKTISAQLPDIHIKNIGKSQGGLSPEKAFKEVFAALYKGIKSPDVTSTLTNAMKELKGNVPITKEKIDTITNKVKELFGK